LRLWWIVPVILVGIWLLTGFYRVSGSHQAVVQRFGAYAGTVDSGVHWYWPWPIGTHESVAVGKDRSISRHAQVMTRDGKLISLRLTVAYRIGNPRHYLFGSADPAGIINALADSGLAQVARESDLQTLRAGDTDALAKKLDQHIGEALQAADTGIVVRSVKIGHVEFPDRVKDSQKKLAGLRKQNAQQAKKAHAQAKDKVLAAGRRASAVIASAQTAARKRKALAKVRLAHFKALLPAWRHSPSTTKQILRADVLSDTLAKLPKVVVSGSVHSVTLPPLSASATGAASGATASASAPTSGGKPRRGGQ
jgi:membrane protease subunit HflK